MKIGETISNPTFQLVAGQPALDFINTLDWRFRKGGQVELLKSYGDLLRFTEQSKILTPALAQQLLTTVANRSATRILKSSIELRETAAGIFYAVLDGHSPSAVALKTLQVYINAARLHQQLTWKNSHLEWDLSEVADKEAKAELPLWLLSLSISRLITSASMQMVRACGDPACRWLFIDTSKNHTRRWCDMKICGNRMKARRFKAQREA